MPAVIVTRAAKTLGVGASQRGHVQQQVIARLFQDRVEAMQGESEDFGQVLQLIGRAGNVFRMMALRENGHLKRKAAGVGACLLYTSRCV